MDRNTKDDRLQYWTQTIYNFHQLAKEKIYARHVVDIGPTSIRQLEKINEGNNLRVSYKLERLLRIPFPQAVINALYRQREWRIYLYQEHGNCTHLTGDVLERGHIRCQITPRGEEAHFPIYIAPLSIFYFCAHANLRKIEKFAEDMKVWQEVEEEWLLATRIGIRGPRGKLGMRILPYPNIEAPIAHRALQHLELYPPNRSFLALTESASTPTEGALTTTERLRDYKKTGRTLNADEDLDALFEKIEKVTNAG